MIFFSLIIYTFTGLIMYLLADNLVKRERCCFLNREERFWHWEIAAIVFIFVFLAGARFHKGADHGSYLRFFTEYKENGYISRRSLEWGFVHVLQLVADCNLHFFFFFALWAFLQIFFVFYAFKNNRELYPYLCLAIMLTPFWGEWMNGVRQTVVCCTFLFLLQYIQQRKFIPYFIGIFICSSIHKSVWLLLPLYFLLHRNLPVPKRNTRILLLLVCIILGTNPIVTNILSHTESIFQFLDYQSYSENVDGLLEQTRDMSWGPVRLSILFSNMFILWSYDDIKSYFKEDKMLSVYFFLFFWGICLSELLVYSGVIFTRPLMYLTTYRLPMIAYASLYFVKTQKLSFQSALFFVLTFSYQITSHMKLILSNVKDSPIVYKFFFLQNI